MGTSACGGSADLPLLRLYVTARACRCPCLRTQDSVDAPWLRPWCEYESSVGGSKRLRALVLRLDEVACQAYVAPHDDRFATQARHERM